MLLLDRGGESISVMCCLQDSDGEDQNYKSPSHPGHTYSFPSTPLPTLVLTSTPPSLPLPLTPPLLTLPTLSRAPPHSIPHTYSLLSTLRTYTCPPLHPSHSIPHSHTTPLVLTPSGGRGCEALPPVGEPCVHPLLSDPLCVPLRTSHH